MKVYQVVNEPIWQPWLRIATIIVSFQTSHNIEFAKSKQSALNKASIAFTTYFADGDCSGTPQFIKEETVENCQLSECQALSIEDSTISSRVECFENDRVETFSIYAEADATYVVMKQYTPLTGCETFSSALALYADESCRALLHIVSYAAAVAIAHDDLSLELQLFTDHNLLRVRGQLFHHEHRRRVDLLGGVSDSLLFTLHIYALAGPSTDSSRPQIEEHPADNDLEAKLTDFGASRERIDRTMTAGVDTPLWMAPELMTGEKYDEKADMFSFGVVLSELDTHGMLYANSGRKWQTSDLAVLQLLMQGKLQTGFSKSCPPVLVELGLACVSMDPAARPTAAQALYKLQLALAEQEQITDD
ncbi:unnamed protein product [Phytophthora lilii]|uniref:Unnamed protein product n=1 Tax=Phytophthora lilii TaxID=2077276 RepID=A0A9W6X9J2_9STRA|nr:unnamed protein product [Phytophthora lilii]